MRLHEYESKRLFAEHGVPIPRGEIAMTPEEARRIAADLGPVVVKAQVLVGGRGKAGGIRLARTPGEAERTARDILAMKIKGLPVRRVLLDQAASIQQEIFLGIVVDRAASRPVLLASSEGGVEIEEVARTDPRSIQKVQVEPLLGLRGYQTLGLAKRIGLARHHHADFDHICHGLYGAFRSSDARLAEINPLVVTDDDRLLAVDGKVVLDDNGLFRHPELAGQIEHNEETPIERQARKAGLSYVQLDGNIGCMVNGAGLAMATMDIIGHFGGSPANFLDIGGGAMADKVSLGLRLVLAAPGIKAMLVNIFGGMTRCDEVARGIITSLGDLGRATPGTPLVVRLIGTNEAEGRAILASSGFPLITTTTLAEAAETVVAAAANVLAPIGKNSGDTC
jgi:succinyl-CoA synthetase beta subunit